MYTQFWHLLGKRINSCYCLSTFSAAFVRISCVVSDDKATFGDGQLQMFVVHVTAILEKVAVQLHHAVDDYLHCSDRQVTKCNESFRCQGGVISCPRKPPSASSHRCRLLQQQETATHEVDHSVAYET